MKIPITMCIPWACPIWDTTLDEAISYRIEDEYWDNRIDKVQRIINTYRFGQPYGILAGYPKPLPEARYS